jgi:hypothetical protein
MEGCGVMAAIWQTPAPVTTFLGEAFAWSSKLADRRLHMAPLRPLPLERLRRVHASTKELANFSEIGRPACLSVDLPA